MTWYRERLVTLTANVARKISYLCNINVGITEVVRL